MWKGVVFVLVILPAPAATQTGAPAPSHPTSGLKSPPLLPGAPATGPLHAQAGQPHSGSTPDSAIRPPKTEPLTMASEKSECVQAILKPIQSSQDCSDLSVEAKQRVGDWTQMAERLTQCLLTDMGREVECRPGCEVAPCCAFSSEAWASFSTFYAHIDNLCHFYWETTQQARADAFLARIDHHSRSADSSIQHILSASAGLDQAQEQLSASIRESLQLQVELRAHLQAGISSVEKLQKEALAVVEDMGSRSEERHDEVLGIMGWLKAGLGWTGHRVQDLQSKIEGVESANSAQGATLLEMEETLGNVSAHVRTLDSSMQGMGRQIEDMGSELGSFRLQLAMVENSILGGVMSWLRWWMFYGGLLLACVWAGGGLLAPTLVLLGGYLETLSSGPVWASMPHASASENGLSVVAVRLVVLVLLGLAWLRSRCERRRERGLIQAALLSALKKQRLTARKSHGSKEA